MFPERQIIGEIVEGLATVDADFASAERIVGTFTRGTLLAPIFFVSIHPGLVSVTRK